MAQSGPKLGFFDFLKNFVICFSGKQSRIKSDIVVDIWSLLQVDSISLSAPSQACPKYPKLQI